MKLTIIVPAFNEERTVGRVIERVLALPIDKEILVVDDGSTDRTWEVLKRFEGRPALRLLRHDKNQGKGAAIRTALAQMSAEAVSIQDADDELDPNEMPLLFALIEQGRADVVFGTRHLNGQSPHTIYYWGDRILTWIFNVLYGQAITDLYNGYKIFRREAIQSITLKSRGFEFEAESAAKIAKKGYVIHELPVSYRPRSREAGKKINWKDAFKGLWTILKYRFSD